MPVGVVEAGGGCFQRLHLPPPLRGAVKQSWCSAWTLSAIVETGVVRSSNSGCPVCVGEPRCVGKPRWRRCAKATGETNPLSLPPLHHTSPGSDVVSVLEAGHVRMVVDDDGDRVDDLTLLRDMDRVTLVMMVAATASAPSGQP